MTQCPSLMVVVVSYLTCVYTCPILPWKRTSAEFLYSVSHETPLRQRILPRQRHLVVDQWNRLVRRGCGSCVILSRGCRKQTTARSCDDADCSSTCARTWHGWPEMMTEKMRDTRLGVNPIEVMTYPFAVVIIYFENHCDA